MKIYLSKSNLHDPVVSATIRNIVEKTNHTLTEFRGGPYTTDLLDKADKVIVLAAPKSTTVIHGQTVHLVGKGVYSEAKRAKDKAYLVTGATDGALAVSKITDTTVYNDQDWKNSYGAIHSDGALIDLQGMLEPASEEDILLCK